MIENLKMVWSIYTLDISENTPAINRLFAELCTSYSESHRHYHTLTHIASMLSLLEQKGYLNKANFWATWFHDVIYDSIAADNEDRSADIAEKWLNTFGCDSELIKKVTQLIRSTKSHFSTECTLEEDRAFLDADMAILGADLETYDKYSVNVRREFSCVPDQAYCEGRVLFLSNTLAMPEIFSLDSFSEQFEKQARINMRREIIYWERNNH